MKKTNEVKLDLRNDVIVTPDGLRWMVSRCEVHSETIRRDRNGVELMPPQHIMQLECIQVQVLKKEAEVEDAERLKSNSPVAPGDFKSDLIERLKDPVYAVEYLAAAIDESKRDDDLESLRLVIMAAKDVAAAHGGHQ